MISQLRTSFQGEEKNRKYMYVKAVYYIYYGHAFLHFSSNNQLSFETHSDKGRKLVELKGC